MIQNSHDTDATIDRALRAARAVVIAPGPPATVQAAVRAAGAGVSLVNPRRGMPRFFRYGLAAAAVLLIATAVGVMNWGRGQSNVAFADVIDQVRRVKTVKYRTFLQQTGMDDSVERDVVAMDGKVSRDETILVGPGGKETVTSINIYNNGRMLNLDPRTKKGLFANYATDGLPHTLADTHTLADLRNLTPLDAKPLGKKVFDGVELAGFHVDRDRDALFTRSVDVWVNPKTKLPARVVENSSRPEADDAGVAALEKRKANPAAITPEELNAMMEKWPKVKTTRTMTEIVWDAAARDAEFSVETPNGYDVRVMKIEN